MTVRRRLHEPGGRAGKKSPIALLSDFGYKDHYVGAMKGVIAAISPEARVIDITHGLPPQSVSAGALALREVWRYFPPRTIFLAVVDPGVGTSRHAVAIETKTGARFVAPDNGLAWLAAEQAGLTRAVALQAPRYRLPEVSATFHGRDIFAPAAAHLWNGVRLASLGPPVSSLQRIDLGEVQERDREVAGSVIYIDHFGNLVTNIAREHCERLAAMTAGREIGARIGRSRMIPLRATFADVALGRPVALIGSMGLLEIAVRDGSAHVHFGVAAGQQVSLRAGNQK